MVVGSCVLIGAGRDLWYTFLYFFSAHVILMQVKVSLAVQSLKYCLRSPRGFGAKIILKWDHRKGISS